MRQILYVSAARPGLTPTDVDAILDTSRRRNAADGLTGLLLAVDGSFLQILEGEPDALEATMARIAKDPRHSKLIRMLERDIDARRFPDWAMGYLKPHWGETPEAAFRISRTALENRLETLGADEAAVFVDTFLRVNDSALGSARPQGLLTAAR